MDLKKLSERSAAAVRAKGTAHMTQESAEEGSMDAQVDYSPSSPRIAVTMDDAEGTFQVLLLDGVVYLGGPGSADADPAKPWMKIDPTADDEFSAFFAPIIDMMESAMTSPSEAFAQGGASEARVTAVDGDVVTYEVVLTKEQLTQAVKSATKGLPGIPDPSAATLPDSLSYTLSLTRDHLPVTMVVKLPEGAVTTTYSTWGEPVDIKAPSADLVETPTA